MLEAAARSHLMLTLLQLVWLVELSRRRVGVLNMLEAASRNHLILTLLQLVWLVELSRRRVGVLNMLEAASSSLSKKPSSQVI